MRARSILLALLLPALALATRGSDAALRSYAAVDVAPVDTSIYIGSVTLIASHFLRQDGLYRAAYTAKVFPYSFMSESGRLEFAVSDDDLRQFLRRQTFDFIGQAIRRDGLVRKVRCHVTQTDATHGKMSVRIFLTSRFSLKFDTTYRLTTTVSSSGIR